MKRLDQDLIDGKGVDVSSDFEEADQEKGVFLSSSEPDELEKLKQENQLLRKSLMAFYEERLAERVELKRRQKLLQASLVHELEIMKSGQDERLHSYLKAWHAPFSLPLRLVSFWLKGKFAKTQASLGGSDFKKVISAYENGGFAHVAALLAGKKLSPVLRGNAYTALARDLIARGKLKEAAEASKLAYMADPRYYRLKWHAFRLYYCGEVREAEILLSYLEDKISFSPSEAKIKRYISSQSWAENELDERAISINILDRAFRPDSPDGTKNRALTPDQEINSQLLAICRELGWEACLKTIKAANTGDSSFLSQKLLQIGRLAARQDPACEYNLYKAACECSPGLANLRAFFWAAWKGGEFLEASRALLEYEGLLRQDAGAGEQASCACMLPDEYSQLRVLGLVERAKSRKSIASVQNRICYIVNNSLPFASGGYAARGHGMAKALSSQGYEVICVTRPGFPYDLAQGWKAEEIRQSEMLDGVKYMRIDSPLQNGHDFTEYMELSAAALTEKFRELRPEIVIAASNYKTALPALIAARRLGLPFIYEVRGLWEITRMSREADFINSSLFKIQKIFESELAKHADHVITITGGLKKELHDRGAPAARISIAPNACDTAQFRPLDRDIDLARKYHLDSDVPVIGYIGTFMDYEGLELLAQACALLKSRGRKFRLLLLGNENATNGEFGPISEEIRRMAREGGFEDWLIMPGRVPYGEVIRYYSLIDIAPFPRKSWPVCEIVSPIKPLEAMAMAKAVLVSSVAPLAELVTDGENGLIFTKDDINDLAARLDELLRDSRLREKLGKEARKFVLKERTWEKAAYNVSLEIQRLLKRLPDN